LAKRVKKKEGEKLTPENIERVISLLSQAKPITKKEACEILNISYNTTRLKNIIEGYTEEKALDEKRRAANRGKPASNQEIKDVIEWYLEGDNKQEIADRLYRSVTFVTNIIDTVGVPQRKPGQNYVKYEPLPDKCVADRF
jgi:transposase